MGREEGSCGNINNQLSHSLSFCGLLPANHMPASINIRFDGFFIHLISYHDICW